MAKKKTGDTETLKELVIEAISEKKGQDIVSLDLRDIHDTVSDYFIIAHGDSNTQVNAIFQSIMESAKKNGQQPYHTEGIKNGEWIIVDFVDVVAHIFHRERREFYQLEELWSDAKVTKHDAAGAIKPKPIRQPNRKQAAAEETLEEIERSLPKSDRLIVKKELTGRRYAGKKATDKKTSDKKAPAKKTAKGKAPAGAKKAAAAKKTSIKKK